MQRFVDLFLGWIRWDATDNGQFCTTSKPGGSGEVSRISFMRISWKIWKSLEIIVVKKMSMLNA